MGLLYLIKKIEIEKLRESCNNNDVDKIQNLLQEIENKKAKEQKRPPAKVNVSMIDAKTCEDDVFLHKYNRINIYFKRTRTAPDIYRSLMHEIKHAFQFHLSNQDTQLLSQFEKENAAAHKLGFCYNIEEDEDEQNNPVEDNNAPSIQYLYNYNELDSKVEEMKELINFIQHDIEHPDRYKDVLRETCYFNMIYNKYDLKEYKNWLINHYDQYHNSPQNDPYCIMQSVIKAEEKLNIDMRKFIINKFYDLTNNKFKQLMKHKKELDKLFLITQQSPEKRDALLEKYKKKEIKEFNNFISNEER